MLNNEEGRDSSLSTSMIKIRQSICYKDVTKQRCEILPDTMCLSVNSVFINTPPTFLLHSYAEEMLKA